jgi:hypothetical protein
MSDLEINIYVCIDIDFSPKKKDNRVTYSIIIYLLKNILFIYFWLWCSLYSVLYACKAGALPLEPLHQP